MSALSSYLLCDGNGRSNILYFGSRKLKKVVRSITIFEMYAFTEELEMTNTIATDLTRIFESKIFFPNVYRFKADFLLHAGNARPKTPCC